MLRNVDEIKPTVVQRLFGEFNETLRATGQADYSFLERCPEPDRKELRSLMNVAALAFRALEPERMALEQNHPATARIAS